MYSPVGTVIPSYDEPNVVYVECAECMTLFMAYVEPETEIVHNPCPTCLIVEKVGKRGHEPLRLPLTA